MIKNAKTLPKVFYGLHMVEGVAEYQEPTINNGSPYRILVGESVIKNMDASYAGKPVYVQHVDQVNLDNLQNEADGYVIESFFNKSDGKHWAKFIVVSDRGHEAIRSGWKLSNAYIPSQFSGGGLWHGVEYRQEVMNASYEHLAIVPNPRYEESIILTPEEFKEYNNKKELELKQLANSKTKGAKSMFNFFKKSKVEDTNDIESMTVTLPKSGKEVSIASIINAIDEVEMKKKNEENPMVDKEPMEEKPEIDKQNDESKKEEEVMANYDHHVMVGEEKMKINDLIEKHLALKASMEPKKEEEKKENDSIPDDEEAKKKALELAEHEEKEIVEEKKQNSSHFLDLKDAPFMAYENAKNLELPQDQLARGKSRYGSN